MSCWTCLFQEKTGRTLFGVCLYFTRVGQLPRDIPEYVVDKGCRFKKDKPAAPATPQSTEESHDGESHDHP